MPAYWLSSLVIAVASYLMGVATPVIFKDTWDRWRKREDAARLFRRRLEPIVPILEAYRVHFERRDGLLFSMGPRVLKGINDKFDAELKPLEAATDRLLDLQDDKLETRLASAIEKLRHEQRSLVSFALPFYPENQRTDIPSDAWSKQYAYVTAQDLRGHYLPIVKNLLVVLQRYDRHPILQLLKRA